MLVMKIQDAQNITKVVAKTTGYGRLKVGKEYAVVHAATKGTKYIFVLDETNNINGYHIRNFGSL